MKIKQIVEPIVITGATGFIGANLLRLLHRNNYQVHILSRPQTDMWRIADLHKKIHRHTVDLLNGKQVAQALIQIKPKTVFHFASYGNSSVHTDPEKILAANIYGTFYLLEAAKKFPMSAFIYAGTSSEYGLKKKPMSETDILAPTSFYGISKSTATHLCQLYSELYQIPTVCLRFFSVYGPYEEGNRFIPTIMKKLIEKQPIQITAGVVRHDFIYVEDVINICLVAAVKAPGLRGTVVNVGSGKEYTNQDVVNQLFKITGKQTEIIAGGYQNRSNDAKHWVANTKKLQSLLNYSVHYSLSQGLNKMYRWFNRNYSLYAEKANNSKVK